MRSRFGLYLLLFVCALIPRALAGRFLTIDEAYHWFERVHLFVEALRTGHYAATNLVGHPGVTTLWLGAFSTWAEQALVALGVISGNDAALHRALLRLPIAIVSSVCIVLALPLVRELFGDRIALLAGIFWAGEPFLVAHSQLLHLDALLSSFVTLSLLSLLVAMQPNPSSDFQGLISLHYKLRYLLFSGLFGGLALLTKSPAVILMPMVGLVLLSTALVAGIRHPWSIVKTTAKPLVIWLVVVASVWIALWPAAWVDLLGAFRSVFIQAQADGGTPHGWGNFFMGQAVSDPGLLFYPVAVALRLAPWTTIGLIVLFGLSVEKSIRHGRSWWRAHIPQPAPYSLMLLVCFTFAFVVMMSIPPKKFDRYALPVFPVLNVLAAVGFVKLAGNSVLKRFMQNTKQVEIRTTWVRSYGLMVLTGLVLAANLAWYHPYELAYFNPLFGGGTTAVWAIPVGWGEGYELVADYLRTQPNGADRPVAALYEPVIDPLAPAEAVPMEWAYLPGKVDYAVLYVDQIQREYKPQLIRGLLGQVAPVHTVTIHGIEYAYIYQIPLPVAHPLSASFGDAIRLRGYDLDTSAIRTQGVITVTLEWEGTATPATNYTLFVHVLDAAGNKIGQADVPPGGARWPTSQWGVGRYISNIQQVPVRADAPAGTYHIAIGMYNPDGFARLRLQAPRSPDSGAGPDALQLAVFEVR